MGLITKEVIIKINNKNIKHFTELEYDFKYGDEIIIPIKHLTKWSGTKVNCECDECGKILENIPWTNYKKSVKEDGTYYCKSCASKLYGKDKFIKTRLKNGKSFENWCIENNRQDILDRWDYELNDCKPSEICYGSSRKKYYFKCSKGLHFSELKIINSFISGQEGSLDCKACNSFAQWGIDNLGVNFLEKYWDYEKNKNINPWEIAKCANKPKIWIKCQEKNYHGSYDITCNDFVNNYRCPYCNNSNGKVHRLDSLGCLYPEVLEIWSDKNKKSPYDYSPMSGQEVYWKCLEGNHKDYKRSVRESNICDFRCPECVNERKESFLQEKVRLYLNELRYDVLHEKNCTIIAQNPKTKMYLRYDNEIILSNRKHLIIEVHGLQHYQVGTWHKKLAKNTIRHQNKNYIIKN